MANLRLEESASRFILRDIFLSILRHQNLKRAALKFHPLLPLAIKSRKKGLLIERIGVARLLCQPVEIGFQCLLISPQSRELKTVEAISGQVVILAQLFFQDLARLVKTL